MFFMYNSLCVYFGYLFFKVGLLIGKVFSTQIFLSSYHIIFENPAMMQKKILFLHNPNSIRRNTMEWIMLFSVQFQYTIQFLPEPVHTQLCGVGNSVPCLFDVLSFVCFGNLCWDNTELSGHKLKTWTIHKTRSNLNDHLIQCKYNTQCIVQ